MFSAALEKVSRYTHPVVVSCRSFNGNVECSVGTFIILNEEGWILTSAHILGVLTAANAHQKAVSDYENRKTEIEQQANLNSKERKRLLRKLTFNEKWITNCSYWWATDRATIRVFVHDNFKDLAAGRLEPFDSKSVTAYPVFMNPKNELLTGTSLCRLGFPFHKIEASYDGATDRFQLAPGSLPFPRFPIDGIYTRNAVLRDEKSGKEAKFLETSSPGLRGQSGGPIFDAEGNIWALQSRTKHLPLGFSPKVKRGDKEVEEHQFINVGLGTHVEEIVSFLTQHNIRFKVSPDS
ncbi:MAG: serine protease [Deltaproteobacteria bacterium HGW-Deltaproteobacteria-15]|jgi:hypothetical protein|nr:MAG: serine protease [Deltaproteobacteria bacterium HGW-Deltaproteobacteria-15]